MAHPGHRNTKPDGKKQKASALILPPGWARLRRKLLETAEGREDLIKRKFEDIDKPKKTSSPSGKDKPQRQAEALARAIEKDQNTEIRRRWQARQDMAKADAASIAKAEKQQKDASAVVSGGLGRAAKKEAHQKEMIAKADAGGYKTSLTRKRDAGTLPWQNKPAEAPVTTSRPRPVSTPKLTVVPTPKPSPRATPKSGATPRPGPRKTPVPTPKLVPTRARSKEWSEAGRGGPKK